MTGSRKKGKRTMKLKWIVLATAVIAAGCSGGESSSEMTQTQIDAIRHPVADPNYKGPSKESLQKMGESMDAYRHKHANDKVEFK